MRSDERMSIDERPRYLKPVHGFGASESYHHSAAEGVLKCLCVMAGAGFKPAGAW